MTFSLGGVTPGPPVALPTMPLSRSQQVGTVHTKEMHATPPFVQMIVLFCAAKTCCFGYFLPEVFFFPSVWSPVVCASLIQMQNICATPQSLGGMASQQAAGQQQKVGVGGQGSLGSTWSDPSVNISLDFLSAGLNPTKAPPTLNNIIQQQGDKCLTLITTHDSFQQDR